MQFIDLAAQQNRLKEDISARITRVLAHGHYIMGPEVLELEQALEKFCGAKYCVSCANGTDALCLALMALEVKKGDAVIVPSFTFAASAEAPCLVGATPFFADVDPDTYNVDPLSVERCVLAAKNAGLTPRCIIAVDLFGLPSNYSSLTKIAKDHDLRIICDSAQGWGASINGRMTGTFGDITTTSFFPAKPLGGYGDGGAIFTDDFNLATLLKSLRAHGKGAEKYDNIRIGLNSRLDTIQAAILLSKLSVYTDEITARNKIATQYTAALRDQLQTPYIPNGYKSIWAQYTLQSEDRDVLMKMLKHEDIPTAVYYPCPLHTQKAYTEFPSDPAGLPISELLSKRVFSLPMHPYITNREISHITHQLLNLTK